MQDFKYDLKIIAVVIAIRRLRNFKQLHIAMELGIDRTSYTRIEQGKARLSPGKFDKIAQVLQTNVGTILQVAKSLDELTLKNNSIEEVLRSFFMVYSPGPDSSKFTLQEWTAIFLYIKRFYPKITTRNRVA